MSLGIAIILISSGKTTAKVNSILFGSILTISSEDLIIISIAGVICLLILALIYNKLVYVIFDEEGAKTAGIRVNFINYLFSILVGATISLSIRVMGILVISSIIVVPVATAMQLKKSFSKTLFFSILFGFIDIILGLITSYYLNSASGGTIAVTSVIVLILTIIINNFKNKR